jgi:hypothetical protein
MAHLLGAAPEMGGSEATCVDFLPRTTQLRASVKPAVVVLVLDCLVLASFFTDSADRQ